MEWRRALGGGGWVSVEINVIQVGLRVDAEENDVAAAMENVAGDEDAEVVAMVGLMAGGGEEEHVVDEEGKRVEIVCDTDLKTCVRFVVVEEEAIQVEVVGREFAEENVLVIGSVLVFAKPVFVRVGDQKSACVERAPNGNKRFVLGKNGPVLLGRDDIGH